MMPVMSSATSPTISPVVQAANALTARWCARLGDEDFALSAAGVWPLLALLASAADELAAAELSTALGRSANSAQLDAMGLIDILHSGQSTNAALGIWTRTDIPLYADWASALPAGVAGTLTDQAALDQWAAEQTGGLIDTFPLDLKPDTAMMLASALAARVKWRIPFDSHGRGRNWESQEPGEQWLSRWTHDLTVAAVIDDTVTRVVVEGDGDLDVHLLLGDQQPADVLAAGLRELSGQAWVRGAADFDAGGPGLTVRRVSSVSPDDILHLELPSFEIKTHHDLLAYADIFGLRSVLEPDTSHLPQLSPVPLFVSEGAQDVLARFFAEGFEAAAVTAFGVAVGSAPPEERYQVTQVEITFDGPFGFLAVHRPSRLAVAGGWVSSPFQSAVA